MFFWPFFNPKYYGLYFIIVSFLGSTTVQNELIQPVFYYHDRKEKNIFEPNDIKQNK